MGVRQQVKDLRSFRGGKATHPEELITVERSGPAFRDFSAARQAGPRA